jgi:hypothetical protein
LLEVIDNLDLKAKNGPLTASEREAMRDANEKVDKLCRDEESKGAQ